MSDRKAVIKNADMSEEMQQDAVECATQALEKYNIEKDIAAYIKKVNTGLLDLSVVAILEFPNSIRYLDKYRFSILFSISAIYAAIQIFLLILLIILLK